MREHHVGGQFIRLAAQAIGQPGTQRRAACGDASRIHGIQTLCMIAHTGGHGADERDLIHHLAQVGQQLADLHAALPVLGKLPRRAEALRRSLCEVVILDLSGKFLPVIFGEHRLRIKEIHLRRPAHHEEGDHGLGTRLKMGLLRREVVPRLARDALRLHRGGEQAVLFQQRGERQRAEAIAIGMQEVTAGAELGAVHST